MSCTVNKIDYSSLVQKRPFFFRVYHKYIHFFVNAFIILFILLTSTTFLDNNTYHLRRKCNLIQNSDRSFFIFIRIYANSMTLPRAGEKKKIWLRGKNFTHTIVIWLHHLVNENVILKSGGKKNVSTLNIFFV